MAQTTANLVATCLSNSNNMETENINTNDIEAPAEDVHDNSGPESSVSNRKLAATGRSRKPSLVQERWKEEQNWMKKASTFPRLVEQFEEEPIAIVIFKWILIGVGIVMLGVVLFFMGEVIYQWSSGQLKEEREKIMENLANNNININVTSTDSDIGTMNTNIKDEETTS